MISNDSTNPDDRVMATIINVMATIINVMATIIKVKMPVLQEL